MEDGKIEWKDFLGKRVKLIITDTNFPRKKIGILENVNSTHAFINLGFKLEAILLSTILRFEFEGANEN